MEVGIDLEAVIERVERCTVEAVFEGDWTSAYSRPMDGAPGAETLFIRQLTCKRGNVTR